MASALPKDGGPVDRTEALKQLVAEVRLLVDHVSSRAGASLGDLKVENPRQPDAPSASATMTPADILLRLDQISERLDNEETQLMPSDFTFLQLTRDSLSRLIRPSSNLTVAYTTLVTQWGRTGKSPAKVGLATIAYPNLVRLAKWHRRSSIIFLFLAIGFTYLAVDLSVRVATGKYVLQTIDVLNGRRDALVSAKESLELSLNKTLGPLNPASDLVHTDGSIDIRAFRVCDRSKLYAQMVIDRAGATDRPKTIGLIAASELLKSHKTPDGVDEDPLVLSSDPEERKLCGQDDILKSDFSVAHQTVADWVYCGSSQIGGVFFLLDEMLPDAAKWVTTRKQLPDPCSSYADIKATTYNTIAKDPILTKNIELKVPPQVLAMGNYLLPVIFSLLGSIIYVILDYSNGIRNSTLGPTDAWLSWIRLILGVVVGACIGLFFTAYGPVTPPPPPSTAGGGSALISSLTLSASGLAFLAGFGVEGVFTMLQQLVTRIFAINQNTSGPASSR